MQLRSASSVPPAPDGVAIPACSKGLSAATPLVHRAFIAFSETDFRKASVETLGGGLRTSRPTSRWALACPALVGLVVLNQPPSKPTIFEKEAAR